jgi:serine/threonine-protein kinase
MEIEYLGPYRIGRRLGKGGMGSVYEALEDMTGQRVAVKALSPQLAAADGFRERFEAEIESLKKLQHEGIVRLYGYGEHEGILFYSMELVDGPSLEQEINSGRRFDWQETLSLAIQVCRALKHAHDHGIVHRDIKPANLLLASGGRVKIADFGIARLFGATQLTNAGGVLGTADYMAPEQADGRPVTEKCDQYSLGCVMYTLLAGRPPFRAKTMPEMLQLQRFAEPEPVRRYAPQAPEQLDRLILQLLSKEPADRFPNVLVLARHMEAMHKALSRPGQTTAAAAAPAAENGSSDDVTAVYAVDATLAPRDLELEPRETTDSDVYEAPTVADEGQLAFDPPPLRPTAPSAASATVTRTATTAPRASRFTTVDDDVRRATSEDQSPRWALALQLAALAAVLGGLAWFGWKLTRPASADDVYATVLEHVERNGEDDLRPIADDLAEFLDRFPDDPRAGEVEAYAVELELQRLERKLRAQARLASGADRHPVGDIFSEAMAVEEANPARAATMLRDLLALYPQEGTAAAVLTSEQRDYLTLARRRLDRLESQLRRDAKELHPVLRDRVMAAERLEDGAPAQALAMYRSIVNLYADKPWAADLVAQARARVEALEAGE